MYAADSGQRTHVAFLLGTMAGGGAERAVIELLRSLDSGRFKLSLLLDETSGELLGEVPEDVQVVGLEGALSWTRIALGARGLIRTVWRLAPDVVVSSLVRPNSAMARALGRLPAQTKTVLVGQNNLSTQLDRLPILKRAFIHAHVHRFHRADALVAVSKGVQRDLIDVHGFAEELVRWIPNPVNVERVRRRTGEAAELPWDDSAPVFVAVGRMVPQKAHGELLDAFARLRSRTSGHLVILGDGPLRGELEATAAKLGIAQDVHMPGFVENPWKYIARSTAFVSTSHWEGFSLAVLEAMACGVAIVHTNCDFGPREVIENGRNGLLVPVGDPSAFSAALRSIVEEPAIQQRLGAQAWQDVLQYDVGRVAAAYEELFFELKRNDE